MKRGNLLKAQHGFMLRLLIGPYMGTINWGILVAGVGGSGDPRRIWEEMGERKRERECNEKCCFCLQNDLKEP